MGPLKAMLKTAWLLEEDDRIGDEVFTAQEKRLAMPPLAPDQDRLQHETVTFDNNSQPTVVDSDHTLLDHDRLQHEAATFDNNSQPTVVDSDHTLFQYVPRNTIH
ncbi:hypothetical protein H257_16750 [Aphanomyces astaci]|uniref:Uncharacterized protein n=1 Tax=Aphanomyces astaci TaxID=112090 RepID=W4FHL2_APHAT|nr:hypothetical protein H257_16750 [Aphanomyces astaci]ETV66950.1 hypothetical protein H257_16750 [Aphanomyces astaci]|eukprot:XP_009843591.1 hypothetical protein H257_16750 [Aphanomyces astaci]